MLGGAICSSESWLTRIYAVDYITGVVATAFAVIAEPHRRQILDLLLVRPCSVGELSRSTGVSQPGTSRHLRVLREAGLVSVRQDAQRRWYELRTEPLAELDAWLSPYRKLWEFRLDALERQLDPRSTVRRDIRTAQHRKFLSESQAAMCHRNGDNAHSHMNRSLVYKKRSED